MIDNSGNLSQAAVSLHQCRARGCLAALESFIHSNTRQRMGHVTGNKSTFPPRLLSWTCIISVHLLAQTAAFPFPCGALPRPGGLWTRWPTSCRCCLVSGMCCSPGTQQQRASSFPRAVSPAASTQTLWPGVLWGGNPTQGVEGMESTGVKRSCRL